MKRLWALAVLIAVTPLFAQQKKWVVFGIGENDYATGINSSGQTTGYWAKAVPKAFIRNADGTLIKTAGPNGATAINAGGEIIGLVGKRAWYRTPDGVQTKFFFGVGITTADSLNDAGFIAGTYLYNHNGGAYLADPTLKTQWVPFPVDKGTDGISTAGGVNNLNQLAGSFDGSQNGVYAMHGYLHDFQKAVFTQLDYPGATETRATAVNDAGEVVGYWTAGTDHAFLWTAQKGFVSFDAPGALNTRFTAVNASGVAIGSYQDSKKVYGFSLDANGKFTVLDAPRSEWTTPLGINASGQIAGEYQNLVGAKRGFIYNPQ